MAEMNTCAIIVAAGSGTRMHPLGRYPKKMFINILGKALIIWTIEAFEACSKIDEIVLVLDMNTEKALSFALGQYKKIKSVVPGGHRRQDSVLQGLEAVGENCGKVVIHDGARPCVTPELIAGVIEEARFTGAAIAAVPVTDTIKKVGPQGFVVTTYYRESLWAVQTPQVFRFDLIMQAHKERDKPYRQVNYTDDATLIEKRGCPVKVFKGDYENIKVTVPLDLEIAKNILERRITHEKNEHTV
ncbi:hypothetical protein LCGC14_1272650 [marine sediment metagenome]|uniref:2-C-methyl-D-erythritol 4-phosphate cytidylyltransferase n=1 Tax=marine sediment metagenome TaxID=412755 RepID=A0A0F9P0L2_9ZZZZ